MSLPNTLLSAAIKRLQTCKCVNGISRARQPIGNHIYAGLLCNSCPVPSALMSRSCGLLYVHVVPICPAAPHAEAIPHPSIAAPPIAVHVRPCHFSPASQAAVQAAAQARQLNPGASLHAPSVQVHAEGSRHAEEALLFKKSGSRVRHSFSNPDGDVSPHNRAQALIQKRELCRPRARAHVRERVVRVVVCVGVPEPPAGQPVGSTGTGLAPIQVTQLQT